MRITSQILLQNTLRGLRLNLENVDRAQQEVSTGRRIRTVSDNPNDASMLMRIDARLRQIDQYRRNATAASTRLTTEDQVLTTIRDLAARAKEVAAAGAVDDPSDPLRQTALAQVETIREQVISLGNTRIGNEYLFSGTRSTTTPFLADGTYVGGTTVRQAEIDEGMRTDVNHTGQPILTDLLDGLNAMIGELTSGTADTIQQAVGEFAKPENNLLLGQAEIGVRLRLIADVGTQLVQRSGNLQDQQEQLRDADPTESVVKAMAAQTALERAYEMAGRVLSINILDYLK
jgi:flagellar hook-associated protein 3 FlgL